MCPYLRGLECHLALIQHSAADMCYVQVDTVLKIRSRRGLNAIPIFASADNEDLYLLHLVNRKPFPFFSKATGVDILNSFKCLIFLFSKH